MQSEGRGRRFEVYVREVKKDNHIDAIQICPELLDMLRKFPKSDNGKSDYSDLSVVKEAKLEISNICKADKLSRVNQKVPLDLNVKRKPAKKIAGTRRERPSIATVPDKESSLLKPLNNLEEPERDLSFSTDNRRCTSLPYSDVISVISTNVSEEENTLSDVKNNLVMSSEVNSCKDSVHKYDNYNLCITSSTSQIGLTHFSDGECLSCSLRIRKDKDLMCAKKDNISEINLAQKENKPIFYDNKRNRKLSKAHKKSKSNFYKTNDFRNHLQKGCLTSTASATDSHKTSKVKKKHVSKSNLTTCKKAASLTQNSLQGLLNQKEKFVTSTTIPRLVRSCRKKLYVANDIFEKPHTGRKKKSREAKYNRLLVSLSLKRKKASNSSCKKHTALFHSQNGCSLDPIIDISEVGANQQTPVSVSDVDVSNSCLPFDLLMTALSKDSQYEEIAKSDLSHVPNLKNTQPLGTCITSDTFAVHDHSYSAPSEPSQKPILNHCDQPESDAVSALLSLGSVFSSLDSLTEKDFLPVEDLKIKGISQGHQKLEEQTFYCSVDGSNCSESACTPAQVKNNLDIAFSSVDEDSEIDCYRLDKKIKKMGNTLNVLVDKSFQPKSSSDLLCKEQLNNLMPAKNLTHCESELPPSEPNAVSLKLLSTMYESSHISSDKASHKANFGCVPITLPKLSPNIFILKSNSNADALPGLFPKFVHTKTNVSYNPLPDPNILLKLRKTDLLNEEHRSVKKPTCSLLNNAKLINLSSVTKPGSPGIKQIMLMPSSIPSQMTMPYLPNSQTKTDISLIEGKDHHQLVTVTSPESVHIEQHCIACPHSELNKDGTRLIQASTNISSLKSKSVKPDVLCHPTALPDQASTNTLKASAYTKMPNVYVLASNTLPVRSSHAQISTIQFVPNSLMGQQSNISDTSKSFSLTTTPSNNVSTLDHSRFCHGKASKKLYTPVPSKKKCNHSVSSVVKTRLLAEYIVKQNKPTDMGNNLGRYHFIDSSKRNDNSPLLQSPNFSSDLKVACEMHRLSFPKIKSLIYNNKIYHFYSPPHVPAILVSAQAVNNDDAMSVGQVNSSQVSQNVKGNTVFSTEFTADPKTFFSLDKTVFIGQSPTKQRTEITKGIAAKNTDTNNVIRPDLKKADTLPGDLPGNICLKEIVHPYLGQVKSIDKNTISSNLASNIPPHISEAELSHVTIEVSEGKLSFLKKVIKSGEDNYLTVQSLKDILNPDAIVPSINSLYATAVSTDSTARLTDHIVKTQSTTFSTDQENCTVSIEDVIDLTTSDNDDDNPSPDFSTDCIVACHTHNLHTPKSNFDSNCENNPKSTSYSCLETVAKPNVKLNKITCQLSTPSTIQEMTNIDVINDNCNPELASQVSIKTVAGAERKFQKSGNKPDVNEESILCPISICDNDSVTQPLDKTKTCNQNKLRTKSNFDNGNVKHKKTDFVSSEREGSSKSTVTESSKNMLFMGCETTISHTDKLKTSLAKKSEAKSCKKKEIKSRSLRGISMKIIKMWKQKEVTEWFLANDLGEFLPLVNHFNAENLIYLNNLRKTSPKKFFSKVFDHRISLMSLLKFSKSIRNLPTEEMHVA